MSGCLLKCRRLRIMFALIVILIKFSGVLSLKGYAQEEGVAVSGGAEDALYYILENHPNPTIRSQAGRLIP